MTTLTYKRGETPFEVIVENLDAKAIAYLLQYGWAQSLQDSIAGAAKAKEAELRETDQFKALPEAEQAGFIADEVELHVLTKLEARMKAIIEGTIQQRGSGEPRDPLAAIAREQINAALKKAGKKVDTKTDTGKELMARLVAQHIEKNRTALQAEADRRKAAIAAVEGVEIDLG